jgi:processive 1,2-diacylglycerol beta-glucosyltransferase
MGTTKRLLILSSSTGAGHDSHASATAAWCKKIYGSGVEVRIDQTLEKSHAINQYGVDFYNAIQRNAPWFHHIYYNVIEALELLNSGTVGFGKDYFINLLEEFQPDAILSVHDCLNLGYFEVAKKILGSKVKCATFCTEFAGGYGYSRNWVNTRSDLFFARTEEVFRTACRRGLDQEKINVSGHWASPDFFLPHHENQEGRKMILELGLNPDRFTLLFSTGGAGAQNNVNFLRALTPLKERLQIIALCGRQSGAVKQLELLGSKEGFRDLRVIPFTHQMPLLLRSVSAVVARAGATTAGEAILSGCPVIFNALGGIMPQEMPTLRYFKARGIGRAIYHAKSIIPILHEWLENPNTLVKLKRRIISFMDVTTPEASLNSLLGS